MALRLQGKQPRVGIHHHQGLVQLAPRDGHGIAALLEQIALGHGGHIRHQQRVAGALQGQRAPAARSRGDGAGALSVLDHVKAAAQLLGAPSAARLRRQPPKVHLQRGCLRPGHGRHGHQQHCAGRQGDQPHPNPFHQVNASASAGVKPAVSSSPCRPPRHFRGDGHHPFHGKSTLPDCQPFPPPGREYLHLRQGKRHEQAVNFLPLFRRLLDLPPRCAII